MCMSLLLHRNRFGVMKHYITCLTVDHLAVNGCHQKVQTADKNISIIHKYTTRLQSISLMKQKAVLGRKPKAKKDFVLYVKPTNMFAKLFECF